MMDWNIEEMTGYKPISTLYRDMSIADMFGEDAIKDTYKRVMEHWSSDYKYLTEYVMVLNWKIWEHHYRHNEKYVDLYNELWMEADHYAIDHLKGDELSYFFRTTD